MERLEKREEQRGGIKVTQEMRKEGIEETSERK